MPDSYRLHYEVRGSNSGVGVALLFLHGFMGSREDWTEAVRALQDFRCVLVDLPGHGRSANCPAGLFPMPQAAHALLAVLDDVGADRCIPVSYSMGARLALYLALTHPERCRGVIVESGSPGLDTEEERDKRRKWDEAKASELERQGLDAFLEDWYRQTLFHSIRRNEVRFDALMERRRHNDVTGLARSLRFMGTGSQASLWAQVAGVRFPWLAVAGELDLRYGKTLRYMVSLSEKGRLVTIPDAGHNTHFENPEAFCRTLREFLVSCR
ncbi:MAG: 2-succinyl-6-hydroxy-2,4-cyclohexadiene-1-carboxylate synthase [Deltaproteobacteria bacterium]|nr:2-succinyl-6-hydroxy-2,4-cyclohexadiene-1-carboxylate synthase [Deltaproteobacteria bacterium]